MRVDDKYNLTKSALNGYFTLRKNNILIISCELELKKKSSKKKRLKYINQNFIKSYSSLHCITQFKYQRLTEIMYLKYVSQRGKK